MIILLLDIEFYLLYEIVAVPIICDKLHVYIMYYVSALLR